MALAATIVVLLVCTFAVVLAHQMTRAEEARACELECSKEADTERRGGLSSLVVDIQSSTSRAERILAANELTGAVELSRERLRMMRREFVRIPLLSAGAGVLFVLAAAGTRAAPGALALAGICAASGLLSAIWCRFQSSRVAAAVRRQVELARALARSAGRDEAVER